MSTKKIIKHNFWSFDFAGNGDRNLYSDQIGWSDLHKADAKSDYPEYIFKYYIEDMCLNLLFYWLEDERFYTIETELNPIEVRKIYKNPKWNGMYKFEEYGALTGPDTSSPGEIIATFDSPSDLWDKLKINGVSIGKVLENSIIIELD